MRVKTEEDLEEVGKMLGRTPEVLDALLGGLGERWTGNRTEGWTPFDVVGHLIHGEETDWIPRAKIILESGTGQTFEPFDRYAQFEKSKEKKLPELLAKFQSLRKENVSVLRSWSLNEDDLKKKGIHPELGEVTLGELIATWVVHDLNHLNQISSGLAETLSGSVGPWKKYLGILNRP